MGIAVFWEKGEKEKRRRGVSASSICLWNLEILFYNCEP
jgi:hypothetical protein